MLCPNITHHIQLIHNLHHSQPETGNKSYCIVYEKSRKYRIKDYFTYAISAISIGTLVTIIYLSTVQITSVEKAILQNTTRRYFDTHMYRVIQNKIPQHKNHNMCVVQDYFEPNFPQLI